MGCQFSSAEKPLGIRVSIMDSNFMKDQNAKIRQKFDQLEIKYESYLSLSCFIQDMSQVYTNEVIVSEEHVHSILKQLHKLSFTPNIYVLASAEKLKKKILQQHMRQGINYFKTYGEILQELSEKVMKKRKISKKLSKNIEKNGQQYIVVKIFLRKENIAESSEIILRETLQNKKITYKMYRTFPSLQESMNSEKSMYIVTDYAYHHQVLNLVEPSGVKVICYCELKKEEIYDPRVYLFTNNFLQIVSQIGSQEKLKHLREVKCTKAFIYCNREGQIARYASILQNFNLQIKIQDSLAKIMKESRFYFCVTILISPNDRKQVQRHLEENDYKLKTKLVEIPTQTENTNIGLRKIIKQIKKGYKAEKSTTKSIDIIDKHFTNVKFDNVKKQLENNDIRYYGYMNLNGYIKNKKFISPIIICNYEEKSLITRYLHQIQSKSQVILFCNKNNITTQLKQNKNYAFVSSHFGKILKYIKTHPVYNPYILDESQKLLKEKKEKLKKQNKRISALKWGGLGGPTQKEVGEMQKNFQFINIEASINNSQIRQIQKESAALLKLNYDPSRRSEQFRKDLVASLNRLLYILKLPIGNIQLMQLQKKLHSLSTNQLLEQIRRLFVSSSSNAQDSSLLGIQLGFRINKCMVELTKLSKEAIQAVRQVVFLLNLNYLKIYNPLPLTKIKLTHYVDTELIQNCQIGSFLLNKNFTVFHDQNKLEQQSLGNSRLELQLECNSIIQGDTQFNSFFRVQDKYIFSPYSLFTIKSIQKTLLNSTIIKVELHNNFQFLSAYFSQVFTQNYTTFKELFTQLLKENKIKHQKISNNILLDKSNLEQVSKNLKHLNSLKAFKNNNISEAIKLIKQVIEEEQSLDNFDPLKLQKFNYELCCFLFKAKQHIECEKLVKELKQMEPSAIIREKIEPIYQFYHELNQNTSNKQTRKLGQQENEEMFRTIILEPTIAHYTNYVENQGQISQEDNESTINPYEVLRETPLGENKFSCLEIDQIDDFQETQKQNMPSY